ncbi:hypothetical protein BJV82DRAFT_658475 [Fennellomyces sp. T-0311]|nr:hypothetical protein BJV82DRAFT_658475 [Fennellomyces sp. T-0311]
MWSILRTVHLARPGVHQMPDDFIQPNGRFISQQRFDILMRNPFLQQTFWETLYRIDHVQRRRWRYGSQRTQFCRIVFHLIFIAFFYLDLPGRPIRFSGSIETDGESIQFRFERPRGGANAGKPKSMIRNFPRNLNLTGWRHGLYTLKKEPMGLIAQRLVQSRLVGIDPGMDPSAIYIRVIKGIFPGKRSFITASPHEEPFNMNPELRRDTIVEVPSRHYQHQVMQNWFNDKENRNRQKANMQVIYDMIAPNTPNTPSFLEFTAYVVTTSLVHES